VNSVFKRLAFLVLLMFAVVAAGTASFAALEGLSAFDALYLTFLTISTLGYSNISPTTNDGKLVAMALLVIGFGIFSTLVVTATQAIFERKEGLRRIHQINTLIALYFSDVGNELLHFFCKFDPALAGKCLVATDLGNWQDSDFHNIMALMKTHTFALEIEKDQLPVLRGMLDSRNDLLLRLLENPHILEHGLFMDMLRAVFHLRHELATDADKSAIKRPTLEHLDNDARKVYQFSSLLWAEHMQYQRKTYPNLFRASLENNPFIKKEQQSSATPSVID
jgi:voltage-gated potassium channel